MCKLEDERVELLEMFVFDVNVSFMIAEPLSFFVANHMPVVLQNDLSGERKTKMIKEIDHLCHHIHLSFPSLLHITKGGCL